MSYGVPITFAAENGDQPASQLDGNFSATLLGINNAYLHGTFGARPAPDGVGNGRYYFATDTGTFYFDNGSSWLQVAAPVASTSLGLYATRGLFGNNNSGTPNTQFDFSADAVQVFDPTNFAVTQLGGAPSGVGTLTNDITAAGPTPNGRDQAGAFANGSFVYFYHIYNPTTLTLATLSSALSWRHGPTALPAGYTRWAPLHANYLSAGGALLKMRLRGSRAWYTTKQLALTDGRATSETAVSLATLIPPESFDANLSIKFLSTASAAFRLRILTGEDWYDNTVGGASSTESSPVPLTIPQISQQFLYLFGVDPGATFGLYAYVLGYSYAKGDS